MPVSINKPTGGLFPALNRPRMPGLALRATTSAPGVLDTGFGNSPSPFPNDKPVTAVTTTRVVDPSQFQWFQSQSGNLASAETALLLSEPTSSRCYLNIRVTADSKGSLAVSVNQNPSTADQASWIINPGDQLTFDMRVPQNRIFGLADNGAVSYVVTSANIAAI